MKTDNYDKIRTDETQPTDADAFVEARPSELDLARAAALEAADSVSASNIELFQAGEGEMVRLMGAGATEMIKMKDEMKRPSKQIDELSDPYSPARLAEMSANIVSWRQSELAD